MNPLHTESPKITALTVRVGDCVVVDGADRTVEDVRALSDGDRLLFLKGGGSHRLRLRDALAEAVTALPPPPLPDPVPQWRAQPARPPQALPVVHIMQCLTCRKKSPGYGGDEGPQRWAEDHTHRLPTHRAFREIIHRPWHTSPVR